MVMAVGSPLRGASQTGRVYRPLRSQLVVCSASPAVGRVGAGPSRWLTVSLPRYRAPRGGGDEGIRGAGRARRVSPVVVGAVGNPTSKKGVRKLNLEEIDLKDPEGVYASPLVGTLNNWASVWGKTFLCGVFAFFLDTPLSDAFYHALGKITNSATISIPSDYINASVSFDSFILSILMGSAMTALLEQQRQILMASVDEVTAIEKLLCEVDTKLGVNRYVLKIIDDYCGSNLMDPTDQTPPLMPGQPMAKLIKYFKEMKTEDGASLVQLCHNIASIQSDRAAVSLPLYPPIFWVMMYSLCGIYILSFCLYESPELAEIQMVGEQVIFALIVMVVVLVLDVLEDLRDPRRGNFSITDELNSRLVYLRFLLTDSFQKLYEEEEERRASMKRRDDVIIGTIDIKF